MAFSCSEQDNDITSPDELTFDERVYQNCVAVQDAAEAYAAAYGEYPDLPCDEFDWFRPDSTALTNPATGRPTEPVFYEPSGIGSV